MASSCLEWEPFLSISEFSLNCIDETLVLWTSGVSCNIFREEVVVVSTIEGDLSEEIPGLLPINEPFHCH